MHLFIHLPTPSILPQGALLLLRNQRVYFDVQYKGIHKKLLQKM